MRPDVHRPGEAENRLEVWQRERFDHALRRLRESGLIPKVAETARAVEGASSEVYTAYEGGDDRGLRYPRVVLSGPWSQRPGGEALPTRLRLTFWSDEREIGDELNLRVREERPWAEHGTTVAINTAITLPQIEQVLEAFRVNPSREGLLPLLQPNPSSPSHAR